MSNGKTRTAARTALFMAVLVFGTKILGFVREMMLAAFFGTSYITDAYVMGTNIPGTLFAGIFTSVGLVFLPLFSRIAEVEGKPAARKFAGETISLMGVVTIVISLLGILLAKPLIGLFAPGFAGETAALAAFYLRIAFFYIFFQGTASIMEGYLQYHNVFLPQTAAGYWQNAAIIGAVVLGALVDYHYMAVGLLLGSALRCFSIWRTAEKNGLGLRPTLRFGAAAKRIAILALPVFIGSTINQINTFVDKWLASGLPEGSVSALNYGNLLVTMVTAVTVTIITTIVYPRLTRAAAAEQFDVYNDALGKGMNIVLMVGVPFTLGCMLYSMPAVQLVYQRGAFGEESAVLTAGAFLFYSIGICGIALNTLICKVYYSMQDNITPVICGVIGAVTNITLNLLFIGTMAHRGLALASSIAALLNSALLLILLKRKHPEIRALRSKREALFICLSAAAAVGASFPVYKLLHLFFAAHFGLTVTMLFCLGGAALFAAAVYIVCLKLCRVPELAMLKSIIKR